MTSPTRLVLGVLRAAGPVTTAEATRLLGRANAQSASATLSALARRGLVVKRATLWEVTAAGAAVATQDVQVARAVEPNTYRSVLAVLTREPQSTAQVAAAAGVERTNAHKRLERLAADGLVERVEGRPVRWRARRCTCASRL